MGAAWESAPILQGKVVVVTGSASGIGYETARVCTALGATVLGVDVTKCLDHVEEFYRADLSDAATIDALVDLLPDGADGLANIAGLPPTAPADRVLAVNLFGLKRLTLGLVPKMRDGGSIVNLASLAGIGWPDAVAAIRASEGVGMDGIPDFIARWNITNDGGRSYFFSKEALIVWTLQNRWAWRDRGIRMNAVSPGPVATPILPDFVKTLGARAEKDMATMDRPGEAADIAPLVAFLLSDMSAWLRGTNIHADGGMASNILCEMHGL